MRLTARWQLHHWREAHACFAVALTLFLDAIKRGMDEVLKLERALIRLPVEGRSAWRLGSGVSWLHDATAGGDGGGGRSRAGKGAQVQRIILERNSSGDSE